MICIQEGVNITDPQYYGSVTRSELEAIFRSDTSCPMPLLDDRLMSLHKAANVLLQV